MSDPSAITGLPDPQRRHERRRHAGDLLLHRESVLSQQVDEVPMALELLKPQLPEAEERVDDLLRQIGARLLRDWRLASGAC
jgi:hypothetical protein